MHVFARLGWALVGCLLPMAGVSAASVTWNFENTAGLPSSTITETSLSGGVQITLKAYYAANNSSTWSTAQFTNQGSAGLGMTHTGDPTGAPDHAIDSVTQKDIVVIDAGAGKTIDWTSLMIGWGYDTYVGGTPGVSGQYTTGQADIKLWTGNTLNTGTATLDSLIGPSFSASTLSNVPTFTNANIDGGSGGNLAPSRYLVMTGDINDAFKLKQLGGTTVKVPEPVSIALLALGLLGLGFARRKSTN